MQKQSATVTENRKISFMESQIFQNGQNTIWKCSLCAAFVAIMHLSYVYTTPQGPGNTRRFDADFWPEGWDIDSFV